MLVVVSGAWIAAVDLTPASSRPFIGSSTNNTELALYFVYNGFGRVGGQQGGRGLDVRCTRRGAAAAGRPGANLPLSPSSSSSRSSTARPSHIAEPAPSAGRQRGKPVPFGGTRSPVRIFGTALGGQAGWLVPLALVGMLALAIVIGRRARPLA